MFFDWSFEVAKPGEVAVIEHERSVEAIRSFKPRVDALGIELGEALVSSWNNTKIVRISLYDKKTKQIIGQAIMLDDGKEISEAIGINSD